MRINLFFALDALLDVATIAGARRESVYLRLTKRDLARIIELVVPEGRDGVLNGPSASQILAAWRTKRLFGPEVIGPMETLIGGRTSERPKGGAADDGGATARFSRNDILRRIEDDRERVRGEIAITADVDSTNACASDCGSCRYRRRPIRRSAWPSPCPRPSRAATPPTRRRTRHCRHPASAHPRRHARRRCASTSRSSSSMSVSERSTSKISRRSGSRRVRRRRSNLDDAAHAVRLMYNMHDHDLTRRFFPRPDDDASL